MAWLTKVPQKVPIQEEFERLQLTNFTAKPLSKLGVAYFEVQINSTHHFSINFVQKLIAIHTPVMAADLNLLAGSRPIQPEVMINYHHHQGVPNYSRVDN